MSVSGTFVEAKMCTFTLESTHLFFIKCPIYTHDVASAKFCTNSHETDYSVEENNFFFLSHGENYSSKAQISSLKYQEHRLNMELDLQSLLELHVT